MNTERSAWAARRHALASLMSRAALGDRAAFARLYDLTSAHLIAVVLRIQRDRALAEDLLQEVYVNLWRSVGSFDAAQSQPMTWLTSVARNKTIDSLRRAQSQPVMQSVHRDDDDDDRPDLDQQMADEAPGPVDLLSQAGDARRLKGLTAPQRQSVALAFFDGLSHCRGRCAAAAAAGHGEELGAPCAVVAQGMPRTCRAARHGGSLIWITPSQRWPTSSPRNT